MKVVGRLLGALAVLLLPSAIALGQVTRVTAVPITPVTAFDAVSPVRSRLSTPVDASRWKAVSGVLTLADATLTSGTYKLQCSNSSATTATTVPASSWTDIAGATIAVTNANNASGWTIPTTSITCRWVRGVWLSTTAYSVRITPVADVGGSLAGKYLLVSGSQAATYPFTPAMETRDPGAHLAALWFSVSGVGSSPGDVTYGGYTYHPLRVTINANDSASAIVTAIFTQLQSNGASPEVRRSTNGGTTWTTAAVPNSSSFAQGGSSGFTHGAGKFVVVLSGTAWQSPDGLSWTTNTAGTPNVQINDMAYGNGLFVAVGNSGNIWTSPDGVTWTSRTSGVAWNINTVAWNGTAFAALGAGTTVGLTSANGTAWSTTTVTNATWRAVRWNGTYFVAVASAGTTAMTSPDGSVWSNQTIASAGYDGLACSASGPCVAGTQGGSNFVRTPDGVTWTTYVLPFTLQAVSGQPGIISWTGTKFLTTDTSSNFWASTDGIAWASRLAPTVVSKGPLATDGAGTEVQRLNGAAVSGYLGALTNGGTALIMNASGSPLGMLPVDAGTSAFTIEQIVPVATQALTATIVGIY